MSVARMKIQKSWITQFRFSKDELNLYNHIDFVQRWWPGLIWLQGNYSKTSNIIMDTTGHTYIFSRVTAKSQGMATPFPAESLFLVETHDAVTVVTERSFYSFGKKLLAEGRMGRSFWPSYLDYLKEFALITWSRQEYDKYVQEGNITFIK